MRVSTVQVFNQGLRRMQEQNTNLSELQTQIATGKKIMRPSDDPSNSVRLLGLERAQSELEQYQSNITMVNQRLTDEETALRGVTNLLLRVRQLTVQANSANLTDADRTSIKKEIEQRYDELLGFANQKDGRGDYLFAGFKGDTQPFQTDQFGNFSQVSYRGDPAQRFVQISTTRQIADSDSGADVFARIESDKAVRAIDNSANTGSAEISNPYLINPDAIEVATLTFADANTGTAGGIKTGTAAGEGDTIKLGKLTYQFVTNASFASEGNVAVVVADGVDEANAIDALETAINNENAAGRTDIKTGSKVAAGSGGSLIIQAGKNGKDKLADKGQIVENSANASAITASLRDGGPGIDDYQIDFTSASTFTITNTATGVVSNSINYVEGDKVQFDGLEFAFRGTPASGDQFTITKSAFQDSFTTMNRLLSVLDIKDDNETVAAGLGQSLADIDKMLEKLNETQAAVGGRINALDTQKTENDAVIFQTEKTRSEVGDVDIVQAISKLQLEKITLQAAQQSFVKLQGLSLFNYLG